MADDSNWSLFYKFDGDLPREFHEVRLFDKSVWVAAGRALTYGEWQALLGVCMADPTPAGARDGALFAILKVTGLRRAEVAALKLEDYDRGIGSIRIDGKRRKVRSIPFEDSGALEALHDWLAVRGEAPGPLLRRIKKGDKVQLQGLTEQGIYHILLKRGQQAGLAHFTPHDLRRTCATGMTKLGATRFIAQRVIGHKEAGVGSVYDRYEYLREKASALSAWASHVERITRGGLRRAKVVPMSRPQ